MIALFVRSLKTNTTNENEYERAVYRLLNEETNQTLDESQLTQAFENQVPEVQIEDAEDEGDEP